MHEDEELEGKGRAGAWVQRAEHRSQTWVLCKATSAQHSTFMSRVHPDGLGTNPALTFMTNCDYSTRKPDTPLWPPWALYTLSYTPFLK